jgi:putative transposase
MDEAHRWEALRYVELNPVRAGLVRYATDWTWSSAQEHSSGHDRLRLLDWADWFDHWTPITWNDVLERGVDDAELLARIRQATLSGRVAGDEEFLKMAERSLGRSLRPMKAGRKPKVASHGVEMKLGIA